jgi:hypothetical protein
MNIAIPEKYDIALKMENIQAAFATGSSKTRSTSEMINPKQ